MRKICKKILSIIMIVATLLSISIPTLAAEVNLDNYDKHPNFEQLKDAYIEYSIQAKEMEKFVTLPLEYFILEYEENGIDNYLNSRILELKQNESIDEVHKQQAIIQSALEKEMQKEGMFDPQSVGGYWFYNCFEPIKPGNYTEYPELLGSSVISGDLVHDSNGSFGITGHSAIVMGHYYSNIFQEFYVRVCEAVSAGVCYGILSDDRVNNRATSVYRVNGGANSSKRIAAANWVTSQIGKPWRVVDEYYKTANLTQGRPNWYCSLLFFAAYKAQGIELDDQAGTYAYFLMPQALINSLKTSKTF